jgi:hypothetical protein
VEEQVYANEFGFLHAEHGFDVYEISIWSTVPSLSVFLPISLSLKFSKAGSALRGMAECLI